MASTVITITGMTCSHCVNAVQAEIGKLAGVADVAVDLDTGSVTISGTPARHRRACTAIDEAGYELVGLT
jgi:copper chaperone CopZ